MFESRTGGADSCRVIRRVVNAGRPQITRSVRQITIAVKESAGIPSRDAEVLTMHLPAFDLLEYSL